MYNVYIVDSQTKKAVKCIGTGTSEGQADRIIMWALSQIDTSRYVVCDQEAWDDFDLQYKNDLSINQNT